LWEAYLPGLGHAFAKFPIFRANEAHEPGANHMGSNYASATDAIYVAYGKECLKLDPATGRTAAAFTLPDGGEFAQVKIWNDQLVAAVNPLEFDDRPAGEDTWNKSCSKLLVVLDRHHGKILWQRTADNAFHHNSIIAGDGVVYCIDRLPPGQEDHLRRRGVGPGQLGKPYRLLALDAETGEVVWSTDQEIFGTWLGYSAEEGVLIQSGRRSPDMISGEPTGRIIAYRAKDGEVLWDKNEDVDDGPYLLAHGIIYMQNSQYSPSNALDMLTGEEVMTRHPLTGKRVAWHFMRNKGCSSVIGCENLLTFRSGAAAYYDLTSQGGVGHLGGFKSGCSSNLVPANGVLSAPDYTRSCNCSYQNQTSLALVPMPGVETWTHGAAESPDGPIQRAGINLGAPGDRVAEDGTLWMEFPVPQYGDTSGDGFTYPNIEVVTIPKQLKTFRHHSSRFDGPEPRWVAASGAVGIGKLSLRLGGERRRSFRVRLFFAEPAPIAVGQRVFSVRLQGQEVLSNFDIIQAAGTPRRTVVREFHGVEVEDKLHVELVAQDGTPRPEPLLCGIEVVAESNTGQMARDD
jgi:outer membrane protein assembly factor BamB